MKIIDVKIIPEYACNICYRDFRSKVELNTNFLIICSKKCEFRFIYKLIQKQMYDIENDKEILKCIGKNKEMDNKTSHFIIYEITKYYQKVGLSNIKYLGSRLKAKAQGSKSGLKAQGSSNPPLMYKGDEPEPEPNFLRAQRNMNLSNFDNYEKGGKL